MNKKTGFYPLDLYCIKFFLVIGKNKCIHVAQGGVYLEKKRSCIVNPLREFAFCIAVQKEKGKLSNKDWNGGMLCGI